LDLWSIYKVIQISDMIDLSIVKSKRVQAPKITFIQKEVTSEWIKHNYLINLQIPNAIKWNTLFQLEWIILQDLFIFFLFFFPFKLNAAQQKKWANNVIKSKHNLHHTHQKLIYTLREKKKIIINFLSLQSVEWYSFMCLDFHSVFRHSSVYNKKKLYVIVFKSVNYLCQHCAFL
jgi:hypothetical protein